jgi:peroxisomal membrane protein 4
MGYIVFGRKNTPVNMQIVLYLLSRVIVGGAKNLQKRKKLPSMKFFHILAAISWGLVMFLH